MRFNYLNIKKRCCYRHRCKDGIQRVVIGRIRRPVKYGALRLVEVIKGRPSFEKSLDGKGCREDIVRKRQAECLLTTYQIWGH